MRMQAYNNGALLIAHNSIVYFLERSTQHEYPIPTKAEVINK